MLKRRRFLTMLVTAVLVWCWALPVLGDRPAPEDDAELVARYAPVFYFHPAEVFRPQTVDVIVEEARLRRSRRLWFDVNVFLRLDVFDLVKIESDAGHFLDVWYGDDGSSDLTNYTAHQAYYEAALSPSSGGPPVTVYAHVVRDDRGAAAIQYWALYFYNDWLNKHEGDWEMVQVMFSADGVPEWVVLSQHHGGTRRSWDQAPVEDGTHPVVYVARGSHANYFAGDETFVNRTEVGKALIEIPDRTGSAGRTVPDVILVPDRASLAEDPSLWPGAEWLAYRGRWGEAGPQGDFGGPLGPADKGEQWEQPLAWGMDQPLDTETWYENRLRVEVVGAGGREVQVSLADDAGRWLRRAEQAGNLAILHIDPPAGGVLASIVVPPGTRWDVVATWPDAATGEVTRFRFERVPFGATGRAMLALDAGRTPSLRVDRTAEGASELVLGPDDEASYAASWNAPDLVFVGGMLPADAVGAGLLYALLAAVLPAFAYVGLLYWVDRYEKEPKRLLAAAFIWGAIPAMVIAVMAELFFRLPVYLTGSRALEAARLGLFAPLLQEATKGAVVLFVAWRYWREFDDVLDGIVYGAMVGFGFAMTGNLISYVGSFLLWGFRGLDVKAVSEGLVYAMNQALYTAVFGAGLGLARQARERWQRWTIPLAAFIVSVIAHTLHGFVVRMLIGLSLVSVLAVLVGLVFMGVVAAWSLARQRRCLQVELEGEVPEPLYQTLTTPGARGRARWRALRVSGPNGWWQARRLQELCAELAFKKRDHRRWPEDTRIAGELERLRCGVTELLGAV